jgi:hypothetical protein
MGSGGAAFARYLMLLVFSTACIALTPFALASSTYVHASPRRRRRYLRQRSGGDRKSPSSHLALLDPQERASLLDSDYEWALANIPFVDFDDAAEGTSLVQAYYFRWRVYRKHLRRRMTASAPPAQDTLCCSGRAFACAPVSAASGWCAGAKSKRECHQSRTEVRPCVWTGSRCVKGFTRGSSESPTCPATEPGAQPQRARRALVEEQQQQQQQQGPSPRNGASAHEWVVTEFEPEVPWAGVHNTISCSAAHHLIEGRWLRNGSFLDSYARFWFDPATGATPRAYTFWAATALLERHKV